MTYGETRVATRLNFSWATTWWDQDHGNAIRAHKWAGLCRSIRLCYISREMIIENRKRLTKIEQGVNFEDRTKRVRKTYSEPMSRIQRL